MADEEMQSPDSLEYIDGAQLRQRQTLASGEAELHLYIPENLDFVFPHQPSVTELSIPFF